MADRRVAILAALDRVFPLGLDVGQFEHVAQHVGQLIERDFDLADVGARLVARFAFAVPFLPLPFADRLPDFSLTLTDAARAFLPVAEMGDVDGGDRNAHQLAACATDHLAVGDVLPQILPHLPAKDLLEASHVTIDAASHDGFISVLVATQGGPDSEHARSLEARSIRRIVRAYQSFLVSPRAKMLATYCSTSVADSSL